MASLSLFGPFDGFAATPTWNPTTGDFLTAANWGPAAINFNAGTTDQAGITDGGTATLSSGTAVLAELWLGNGGTTSGNVIQTGGDLTLTNGLVVARQGSSTGLYTMTGGTITTLNFRIGGGTSTASGQMTISGSGTKLTTTSNDESGPVGIGVNGTGIVTLSNSAVWKHTGTVALEVGGDNDAINAAGGHGTLNVQSGASLTESTADLAIGRSNMSVGLVTVDGGSIVLSGSSAAILIGTGNPGSKPASVMGSGTLTLNSGSISASVIKLASGPGTGGTGVVNFDGGTATIGGMVKGSGSGASATVHFSGSTIQASGASSNFLSGFAAGDLDVSSGGLKFDTNGHNVTITQSFGGTGGLEKLGAGTLTLSGTPTFAGGTEIDAGKLTINTAYVKSTANVTMASSATFDLEFAGTDTIHNFIVDGSALPSGLYGAVNSGATFEEPYLNGTGFLFVSVPEPSQYAGGLAGLLAVVVILRRRRHV